MYGAGCGSLARLVLRNADAGERPISNQEFCHAHARVKIARDRAAGLKVYDDRVISAVAFATQEANQGLSSLGC
jgi:hypothetical protein